MVVKNMILIILGLILSNVAQAEKSISQLQQEENIQDVMDAFDNMEKNINVMTRVRETKCQKAFGYKPFCECVMKELPIAWDFDAYIAITTKTKKENGYENMSKELKGAYDKVEGIRNSCVNKVNKK